MAFLLVGAEILFSYTADGAYPVIGKVFESCAGGDAIVGVALSWVIYIPASVANVLHNLKFL